MTNGPPKKRARRQTGQCINELLQRRVTSSDGEASRALQLLCLIARSQINIESKLDDIAALAQQQVDLLRRIVVHREHAP